MTNSLPNRIKTCPLKTPQMYWAPWRACAKLCWKPRKSAIFSLVWWHHKVCNVLKNSSRIHKKLGGKYKIKNVKWFAYCLILFEYREYRSRFSSDETVSFCLRVMVGVIILYDYVHPVGAFAKSSKIDVSETIISRYLQTHLQTVFALGTSTDS